MAFPDQDNDGRQAAAKIEKASVKIEAEFIKAYDDWADSLFRHCYYRVYDREKARDLMQEIFLKTWKYIASGREVDNLKAFLYKVAHNLIIDRAKARRESSLDELREAGFDPGTDDSERLLDQIDGREVLKSLDQIDRQYRDVILMKYVDGLTTTEIAQAIGESENAVYVRMHRGIKQIKKLYRGGEPN